MDSVLSTSLSISELIALLPFSPTILKMGGWADPSNSDEVPKESHLVLVAVFLPLLLLLYDTELGSCHLSNIIVHMSIQMY